MKEALKIFAIIAIGFSVLVFTFLLLIKSIERRDCKDYLKYRYENGSVPIKCYEEVKL